MAARRAARTPRSLDDILDVATRVFLERGYDGTSMDEVAHAVGITKSSLYHHVSSKEALLEHGVTRALDALFAVLDEPGSLSGPAVQRLRHVLRRTVEVICDRPAEVTLLVRVLGSSDVQRAALERRREFDRSVTRLVRKAIADGDVDQHLDPELFTRLVLGQASSIVSWYRPDGRYDRAHIIEQIERLVLDGATPR